MGQSQADTGQKLDYAYNYDSISKQYHEIHVDDIVGVQYARKNRSLPIKSSLQIPIYIYMKNPNDLQLNSRLPHCPRRWVNHGQPI